MSFDPPNYTQVPNALFDMAPRMKPAELRVTLQLIRYTFGWQAGDAMVRVTLTQLMEDTGMVKESVLNGLADGLERGTIRTAKQGRNSLYGLVFRSFPDGNGLKTRPVLVWEMTEQDADGLKNRPQSVQNLDQNGLKNRPIDGENSAPGAAGQGAERKGNKGKEKGRPAVPENQEDEQPQIRTARAASGVHTSQTGTPRNGHSAPGRGTGQATDLGSVPPAPDSALAVLALILHPMPVEPVVTEYVFRSAYADIDPDDMRRLAGTLQATYGKRGFRTALIEKLDELARPLYLANHAGPLPTKPAHSPAGADADVLAILAGGSNGK